ncbi:MAG: hypothetical protein KY397_01635 [Gemmatimonadetes bacterium]|nr:hypothetical protein [Gemmatimonadota bacterium]
MPWRRRSGEMEWHRCRNCENWPDGASGYAETDDEPAHRSGGAAENPVCERCEDLVKARSCEE